MNYSAQQIQHVYSRVKELQRESLKKVVIPIKQAFANYYFQINDVFTEKGIDNLKYQYVGYGGVCFLGNISGKVPTQGLYYKDEETKKQIEGLIISLSAIFEDSQEAIKTIREQHGQPQPQYAILYANA
jgi:hypothetical protein